MNANKNVIMNYATMMMEIAKKKSILNAIVNLVTVFATENVIKKNAHMIWETVSPANVPKLG